MYKKFIKRFLDIVFSLFAIMVLSPVLLIVTILVAIKLGRPVLFCQYRPGKDGKIFKIYKFRTMTNARDENGELKPDAERLTKFGKFLRKSSLDELPQLFNIIKGDMSFIGPRPRMISECVFLTEEQKVRYQVRPGITGMSQVNGRNSLTFDGFVEYDIIYINKLSFWLDVKIFFKTIWIVLKHKDVNKEGTVSNEHHGKYLLRMNRVTQEEYDEKMKLAKQIEADFIESTKKNKKKTA